MNTINYKTISYCRKKIYIFKYTAFFSSAAVFFFFVSYKKYINWNKTLFSPKFVNNARRKFAVIVFYVIISIFFGIIYAAESAILLVVGNWTSVITFAGSIHLLRNSHFYSVERKFCFYSYTKPILFKREIYFLCIILNTKVTILNLPSSTLSFLFLFFFLVILSLIYLSLENWH